MRETIEKTVTETDEESVPAEQKPPKKNWLRRHRKAVIAAAVVVVAVVAVRVLFGGNRGEDTTQTSYVEEEAAERNITSSLSGSGTLQPANSYTVTTLVEGEVLSANFEESDVVEKDTVLYEIDSSDVSSNIERSQISLNQAQRAYEDTIEQRYVKASVAGTVYTLSVEVGDEVSAGQTIATIRNTSTMDLVVPFPADDAKTFYVGQSATVTLDGSFETLSGTVKSISGTDLVGTGNMITRNVTIAVSNPGGLSNTQAATAVINGIGCAGSGTFSYQAEATVTASTAGTVTAINVPEGSYAAKDQIIVTLGGEDIEKMLQQAQETLRTSEISMESTEDQLDNYTITAPISGTIVDKEYQAGEKVDSGKTMCIIYDLSYLEMTLNIDELDISKVQVGQTVTITADAVEGRTYEGVITKVSVAGTTTGSVTSYPVTVRIDETDGLLPGMNVDAEIVLEEAENTLSIPNGAVARGNLVLITADSPSAVNAVEQEAPEGYVYVAVETGVSDDDYIEITSGLQAGDKVAYIPTSSGGMGFMMGMMGGGGMAVAMEPGGGPMG